MGFVLGIFKMDQMMRWRYCSNFYIIGDYNTIGICVMRSCWIVDIGVKAYMKKLKCIILMWNVGMLEHVGFICSNAYLGFKMALSDVPLPTERIGIGD